MKILQVIPYFVPAWDYGGPVQVAYGLSRELIKRGHEVVVYTTDALNANSRVGKKEEVIDGIRVKRFSNISNALASRYNISVPLGWLIAASRELSGFDIIHMHEYRTLQNVIAHYYARKHVKPYVLQAHGSLATFFQKGKLKRIFDAVWGYRILRDAAKLFALTQTEAEQYKGVGLNEGKVEIVPNGIDLSQFYNLPPRGRFREEYGLNESQKTVLYLGRIHQTKGLDLLVEAFARLPRELGSIKLVIVGPDEGYLSELEELIRKLGITDRVLITGPLYQKDELEAYVDSDVYVLPSGYETFPITVLEACACGVPVIVTDRCQIANLVRNNVGLVVSYDKDQLGDAMLHILNDEKMRLDCGEKGKLLVREQLNWAKIAERVEQVYLSCLPLAEQGQRQNGC